MFVEIRSKEKTIKRFATGEMVGKIIGCAIMSESPKSFAQVCYACGFKPTDDGKFISHAHNGLIISEDTHELSW